jgi:hypothetical protein
LVFKNTFSGFEHEDDAADFFNWNKLQSNNNSQSGSMKYLTTKDVRPSLVAGGLKESWSNFGSSVE